MSTKPITYKCFYCGKRFTVFGRKAEITDQIQKLLCEYKNIISSENSMISSKDAKRFPTSLDLINAQAKCCDRSLILNTYNDIEGL